jgi:hypothetical protein
MAAPISSDCTAITVGRKFGGQSNDDCTMLTAAAAMMMTAE